MDMQEERRLRARIAELEDDNRALRRELGQLADEAMVATLQSAFRLPPAVARLLSALHAAKGPVPWHRLLLAVPPRDTAADPLDRDDNNIRIHISVLRRRLPGSVETVHRCGYRLTAEGRARVDEVLK